MHRKVSNQHTQSKLVDDQGNPMKKEKHSYGRIYFFLRTGLPKLLARKSRVQEGDGKTGKTYDV